MGKDREFNCQYHHRQNGLYFYSLLVRIVLGSEKQRQPLKQQLLLLFFLQPPDPFAAAPSLASSSSSAMFCPFCKVYFPTNLGTLFRWREPAWK